MPAGQEGFSPPTRGCSGTFEQVGRGRYRLSPVTRESLLRLSTRAEGDSHAVLERLHQATGGLAALYTLTSFGGAKRACIDVAFSDITPEDIGLMPCQGVRVTGSLRTGAAGRVILAHLPEPHLTEVLNEPLPPGAGPEAARDAAELAASLPTIRERGYSVGRHDCLVGWGGIAAPVLHHGSVVGAVLTVKPAAELPADECSFASDISVTKAAAAELSSTDLRYSADEGLLTHS
jgi:DNA-binding IclR family transcriptional regulator